MRRESSILALMLLSLVLCSCGGSSNDTVDLDGVWSGSIVLDSIPDLYFAALIDDDTAIFYDGSGTVYSLMTAYASVGLDL